AARAPRDRASAQVSEQVAAVDDGRPCQQYDNEETGWRTAHLLLVVTRRDRTRLSRHRGSIDTCGRRRRRTPGGAPGARAPRASGDGGGARRTSPRRRRRLAPPT